MEQKAKRVGSFNIIDIIAVVLILAVLVFAGMKLMHRGGGETAETPMTKVTYVVRAEASGALVGGQIESVEQGPYYVLGPDGQWVEDLDHVTLYFTATTQTPTTEVMTTKVGDQEVRIGKKDYILKSEYIEINGGTIVDVQWEQ